jgi:DNA polymerase-3 subunit delta
MPPAAKSTALVLVCGDDDFAVGQRARQLYQQWCAELGGQDHEIIDGAAANSGEALKALGRLREALQTLPFFGSGKAVWLRGCNFLGEDRTATAQAVTDALAALAQELKTFAWQNVRLLISASGVDKRRVFYKTVEKTGAVETLGGWSADAKDWVNQAEVWARGELAARGKEIADQALAELVTRVGPNARLLTSEVEKLSLYVGDRPEIAVADVETICLRNKFSRAFALGDALGERNLPRLLSCLDEELWEMKSDRDKSVFGLLHGLITKVRVLLQLKEMLLAGWLKAGGDYSRFKLQLERVPADQLPQDRRYNPLALNPYVLFKALPQVGHYSRDELVRAMDLLLECNQRLFSRLDADLVLQQTLVQIVSRPEAGAA